MNFFLLVNDNLKIYIYMKTSTPNPVLYSGVKENVMFYCSHKAPKSPRRYIFIFAAVPWCTSCLLHACLLHHQEMRKRQHKKKSGEAYWKRESERGRSENKKSGPCSESLFHALEPLKIRRADWQPDLKQWVFLGGGVAGVLDWCMRTNRNATGNIRWSQTNLKGKRIL